MDAVFEKDTCGGGRDWFHSQRVIKFPYFVGPIPENLCANCFDDVSRANLISSWMGSPGDGLVEISQ